MYFKNISDAQLDQALVSLAGQEREITIKVLHHLRENESRRLYSALGYKSLFDYAVKRLGYSEDQAARRISAMRLLKELPEIEGKIESGTLNLTNLGMAQTLFRQEQKAKPMAKAAKLALLERLENTSTRAAERIVLEASSAPVELRPDRQRALPGNRLEMRFVADEALAAKLEELKGLLAHSQPDCSTAELLHRVCDIAIEKLSPGKRKVRSVKVAALSPAAILARAPAMAPAPAPADRAVPAPAAPQKQRGENRPQIPSRIQKEVWVRAGCKCQNCGSQRALQIDHIKPFALGGLTQLENLRLLCRSCNQRASIEVFGRDKMGQFLKSITRGAPETARRRDRVRH